MKKYSDAELHDLELVVDDAYALPAVLERLPDGVKIVEVINLHEHKHYPEQQVYCCVCGVARHKKGYRVRRDDSVETLLGNCCAEPILGRKFAEAAAEHADLRKRQTYVREIRRVAPECLIAKAGLHSWRELASALRASRFQFRTAMEAVFELLQQAASHGELLATERVRRLKANADDKEDKEEDYFYQDVPVRHVLSGPAYLRRGDPMNIVDAVEEAIRAYRNVADNTDGFTTAKLKTVSMRLRSALDDLRILEEMRKAAFPFFGRKNLAGIDRWAKLLRAGHDRKLKYDIAVESGAIVNLTTGARVERPALLPAEHSVFNIDKVIAGR